MAFGLKGRNLKLSVLLLSHMALNLGGTTLSLNGNLVLMSQINLWKFDLGLNR